MDNFCRVCARSSAFQSFDLTMVSQITQERIDDMLVYCTQQEVTTEDGFPQQICAECFATLNSAFLFRKLTYQSAASFQANIANNVSTVDQEVAIPSTTEVTIKEEQMDTAEEELLEPSGKYPEETTDHQGTNESGEIEANLQKRLNKKRLPKGMVLTYMCKECLYSSQLKTNFKRHQNACNHSLFTQKCSKPVKRFSEVLPDASTAHMQCDKSTFKKTTLFRCKDCDFQTFVQQHFRRHQSIKEHSGQNLFLQPFSRSELKHLHKCPACGDLFASVSHLAYHMKKAIANYRAKAEREAEIDVSMPKDTEIKQESEAEQSYLFGDS